MGAIARFTGPKADYLSDRYLNQLRQHEIYGLQTIEVNGKIEIWDVQADKIEEKCADATTVELPTHLAGLHADLLKTLTTDADDVFATACSVVSTMGAADGNVF